MRKKVYFWIKFSKLQKVRFPPCRRRFDKIHLKLKKYFRWTCVFYTFENYIENTLLQGGKRTFKKVVFYGTPLILDRAQENDENYHTNRLRGVK